MKTYDVSMEIHENMMVYNNKKKNKPRKKILTTYKKTGVNQSEIFLGLHTGTHIDAPFHMIDNGETIEKIDLSKLTGKVHVIDMIEVNGGITADDLKKKNIENGGNIFLKTKNSYTTEFDHEFVFLEKSGAEYLANLRTSIVGIDSLGIERGQPGHTTHTILMNSGCIIIEGLRLKNVEEGVYMMYALPLKIRGGDGAPARVILTDII